MQPELLDPLRACRRSRTKVRVWNALAELGIALIAELADAAHTTPARVKGVLHGDGRHFREDSSLVRLGVAIPQDTPRGRAYTLTPHGARAWPAVRERLRATGRSGV